MELLTPNPGLIVWTIITFIVVLLILRRYAWKPILEAMERRERGIQQLIEEAEREREEAQKLLEEYHRQLAEAAAEAQRILAEGKSAAERVRQEMLARAGNEADAIVDRAGQEIDLERRKALAEIRERAVDLAISAAGKVIEEELDESRHRRIVEDYLREIDAEPERVRREGPARA